MFPIVTVAGSPYDCGRQYGLQARDRVERSIAAYADLLHEVVGWDWQQVTTHAQGFLRPIRNFDERHVEELMGIADGAGVTRDDVLAINLRTEILLSAQVQAASMAPHPSECTALAHVTADGRVLAAQNWDWMPFASDTVVALRAQPDDGPSYVTVVEAGLLAKLGLNSAGVAVLTNALACTEDRGEPGVPYHVLLRALLGCGSATEAVGVLEQAERASSANYLIADSSGSVVDVEARPGGPDQLHLMHPDADGWLVHTNHFVSPGFDGVDYADLVESTSHFRRARASELVAERPDKRDEVAESAGIAFGTSGCDDPQGTGATALRAVLADHADAPGSICRHPIRSLPMVEQVKTVASAVIDPVAGRMTLADGPPCMRAFEPVVHGFEPLCPLRPTL